METEFDAMYRDLPTIIIYCFSPIQIIQMVRRTWGGTRIIIVLVRMEKKQSHQKYQKQNNVLFEK